MKYTTCLQLVGVAALTICCNKTEAERAEERAMDRAHERQEEALDQKQARQEENLEQVQKAEEKALEQNQKAEEKALDQAQNAEEKNLEQRHEALQPAAIAKAAPTPATGITEAAVAELSVARCTREARCGNIGGDKDYATVAQCETKITQNMKDELNGYECPNGIVAKEFKECLQAIRKEACGSPLDTIERVVACRESDICAD